MLFYRVVALFGFVSFVLCTCGDGENYDYCGVACYSTTQYICYDNQTLCPMSAPQLCGENSCFSQQLYQCCHGNTLYPAGLRCPPIPECCGGSGPLIGAKDQRETCYDFSDMEGFATNPTTGEPYFYYRPCVSFDSQIGCVASDLAPSQEGCRQCGLDPVNDIRCEDWTPSVSKRSGAGFQCPCEIIDYLNRTNPDILPDIYKNPPNCTVPTDCERTPSPAFCGSTCGEGVCYQESEYVCNAGNLCPIKAPNSCGRACYNSDDYTCCPGDILLTGKDVPCPEVDAATNGCCPAEGIRIRGTKEEVETCYNFTNAEGFPVNPQTGEPYFSFRPCTYGGDQQGCVDPESEISQSGCRQCWLPPNEDIRCPGNRKRSLPGYECPCDLISFLLKKDPSLLPPIYRSEPRCGDQLDNVCLTSERYGVVPATAQPDTDNNNNSMGVQLPLLSGLIFASVLYLLF